MASRYEEYFGMLDKAAVYFAASCVIGEGDACKYCPLVEDCDRTPCKDGSFVGAIAKVAEWLRGDA